MPTIVRITGLGLVTPLGSTISKSWDALCAGRRVFDHARVPLALSSDEPRVNALATMAAREAVTGAGWGTGDLRTSAVIVGTSKGPVDAWLDSAAELSAAGAHSAHAFGLADTAAAVAERIGCAGPRLTLSGACASGLLAVIRGAMMIQSGDVRRAVIVAAESSLHPLFLASFSRLGVLAPPGHGCRPFDRSRAGFFISEAAAAVCLEAEDSAVGDRRALAVVDQFAMGADATHLTGGDPDATVLRALLRRCVDNRAVDLIHAHGTGTLSNDPIELAAIESAIAAAEMAGPGLYSHKGALGHSLGAAGLVALVINCLCHRDGVIPPNVAMRDPIPTASIEIRPNLCRRAIHRSLALAAGFGGAIAAISVVSPDPR